MILWNEEVVIIQSKIKPISQVYLIEEKLYEKKKEKIGEKNKK